MRVIAGKYRGFNLYSAKTDLIRPTSDRIREFIFSYLQDTVEQTKVLDIFAGTGSLGIEAYSRGANEITFVDNYRKSIDVLNKNMEKCGLSAHIYRMSAQAFPKFAQEQNFQFDLVFCDPPYRFQKFDKILDSLRETSILSDKGIVVYEYSSRNEAPLVPGYHINKNKILGDTAITFYQLS